MEVKNLLILPLSKKEKKSFTNETIKINVHRAKMYSKFIISIEIIMCLADILSGYLVWAPFTLIIKGTMALVAALIVYRGKNDGTNVANNIVAFVAAGIWMVFAYYIAGAFVTSFLLSENVTFAQGLIVSLKDIPANIIEVLVGIALAIPLGKIIRKSSYKF